MNRSDWIDEFTTLPMHSLVMDYAKLCIPGILYFMVRPTTRFLVPQSIFVSGD